MDRTGIPVFVGLAVGVAFVVLFSVVFAASGGNGANRVSIVTIPRGSSIGNDNFEPEIIKVIIGINNTVRWVNNDRVPSSVVANTVDDPAFFKDTNESDGPNFLLPDETFEFTFTKAGEYKYHSEPHPWMKGTVVVLEPGEPDDRYKELVGMNLRQDIENTPLMIYVNKSGDSVQVNVVHSFVINNSDFIRADLVYPTWTDDTNPRSERLTDRYDNVVPHGPIIHLTILRTFDAVCPYTEITVDQDGSINESSTNMETTVHYGLPISTRLHSNMTGILRYSYGLGAVEPDEKGTYRLTFVTPYEAQVDLSDELEVLSYERSNCAVEDSDLTIPYYDIIFRVGR